MLLDYIFWFISSMGGAIQYFWFCRIWQCLYAIIFTSAIQSFKIIIIHTIIINNFYLLFYAFTWLSATFLGEEASNAVAVVTCDGLTAKMPKGLFILCQK